MSLTACERPWRRACVAGLLGLAALVGGLLNAGAAPAPEPRKKEEPKKDEVKKDAPKGADVEGLPSLEEMLKHLPPGMTAEQLKQMRKDMERALEAARRAGPTPILPAFPNPLVGAPPALPFNPFRSAEEERLGVQAQKPGATLVEQLDLPKGQGLVVAEVEKDSAAARAGVKQHDILLEVNGKAVPSDVPELRKLLGDVKADAPVDVVVLRKGKKETLKGLTLPEAKAPAAPGFPVPPLLPLPAAPAVLPVPAIPLLPALAPAGIGAPGDRGVLTVVFRTGDRFTTRHEEGRLIITVTGKVADGKAKVSDIHVQDGGVVEKGESVDALPERYRDKVKNLLEMSEKTAGKTEIKVP
jgi:hypothetical protein